MSIRIEGFSFSYGSTPVLHDVSLQDARPGELIGLVGPHVARMLVGEEQRYFLPASAIAGAILLAATSLVSKSILPGVIIPVGIITALIGVPFFLALIFSRRRQLWS